MAESITVDLLPAQSSDAERLAELRAEALFDSLNQLGRYSEQGVRERFYRSFDPQFTKIIEVNGEFAGCVALKPKEDGYVLEHFYLQQSMRGSGVGAEVLQRLLHELTSKSPGSVVRLNVLQKSPAKRLYERFGFEVESEDEIDVFMKWQHSM
ncbi:GNAT family N-acetyltransferase [Saccharibacillus sp. JS10]|uniref:GNAT family N-acetyltransferase n=1 Tax=Saccharibacillus sp. JS10 TaxID=2950552 RepID=UPI00210DBC60|nr:GNAT family N-acetyltransferase [Saccharibacillus sp. JS10]MCQ4087913.1 GNAT family N-acetyltransferase [Saccharibacillus sp. JS10]